MFTYLKYIVLILVLNSCVLPQNLNIDENLMSINQSRVSTSDSCSNFSYVSELNSEKYGKMFVEYINLDSSCKWNGLQRGFFVDLFKSTIKL